MDRVDELVAGAVVRNGDRHRYVRAARVQLADEVPEIVAATEVPTVAEPVPAPEFVKYAYAPNDAIAATTSTASRAMPRFDLMTFICCYPFHG